MKKVGLIIYNLNIGGAEKLALDYCSILREEVDIDVLVFRDQGNFSEEFHRQTNVIAITKNTLSYALFRFLPLYQKYLINKIVKKYKYDVIVGYMEGRTSTIASYVKEKVKKISWIHIDTSKYDIGISKKEAQISYEKMDEIICVSDFSKNTFLKTFDVNPNKVSVIYNLVDEAIIKQKAEYFPVENKVYTFTNVGVMREQKKQERLVRIAKVLKDEGYNFKIQIVGTITKYGESVTELARDLGVLDVIDFLGFQKNPYPYIKNSDCVVLSSAFEGYPVIIVEALTFQKNIITTEVSGVVEMLEGGKYGVIVDNDEGALLDEMRKTLKNESHFKEIHENLQSYESSNLKIKGELIDLFER